MDPKKLNVKDQKKSIDVETFEQANVVTEAEALAKLMEDTCQKQPLDLKKEK